MKSTGDAGLFSNLAILSWHDHTMDTREKRSMQARPRMMNRWPKVRMSEVVCGTTVLFFNATKLQFNLISVLELESVSILIYIFNNCRPI